MQVHLFQGQGRQLRLQAVEETAQLRVAAAHRQQHLVARQAGLRIEPEGVFATGQGDALLLGQGVDAVDSAGGVQLRRQVAAQVLQLRRGRQTRQRFAGGVVAGGGQLGAILDEPGLQVGQGLARRQQPEQGMAQGQDQQRGAGQPRPAEAAGVLDEDQPRDAHPSPPRSPAG
ncbi:hypothetical protein D3C78_805710 [compost metagenome]